MARAVVALQQGFDYQARWFWCEALRLLRSEPVLERVAIEAEGPRGFDDIVSHRIRPRDQDVWGKVVGLNGFQAKFHVDHSRLIRACDLADPAFILAKTSLLQRLKAAVASVEAAGLHGRFTLITPWQIDRNDLLAELCGTNGELRLSVLFGDGTGGRRPAASRRPGASFIRGLQGLQRRINRAWRRANYYLGEWHFHPFARPTPSSPDRSQIVAFSKDPAYRFPEPILIVVGGDPQAGGELWVSAVLKGRLHELRPWRPGILPSRCRPDWPLSSPGRDRRDERPDREDGASPDSVDPDSFDPSPRRPAGTGGDRRPPVASPSSYHLPR